LIPKIKKAQPNDKVIRNEPTKSRSLEEIKRIIKDLKDEK
jgi:hypothetical protein